MFSVWKISFCMQNFYWNNSFALFNYFCRFQRFATLYIESCKKLEKTELIKKSNRVISKKNLHAKANFWDRKHDFSSPKFSSLHAKLLKIRRSPFLIISVCSNFLLLATNWKNAFLFSKTIINCKFGTDKINETEQSASFQQFSMKVWSYKWPWDIISVWKNNFCMQNCLE